MSNHYFFTIPYIFVHKLYVIIKQYYITYAFDIDYK